MLEIVACAETVLLPARIASNTFFSSRLERHYVCTGMALGSLGRPRTQRCKRTLACTVIESDGQRGGRRWYIQARSPHRPSAREWAQANIERNPWILESICRLTNSPNGFQKLLLHMRRVAELPPAFLMRLRLLREEAILIQLSFGVEPRAEAMFATKLCGNIPLFTPSPVFTPVTCHSR